jgi:hypothetical protein
MAQNNSAAATLFDKMNNLSEGDNLELLGESLTVGHMKRSAASKTLSLWGSREDMNQRPRYDVVLDPRYDSFEIFEERTSEDASY